MCNWSSNWIADDAQAFLTEFGKEYLKGFGGAMLDRIAAEVEGEDADVKKLSYRDVNIQNRSPWIKCMMSSKSTSS